MRHGLIPIENSLSGTLHSVLELFAQQEPRLWVVGEYTCNESHYIMARPGTELKGNNNQLELELNVAEKEMMHAQGPPPLMSPRVNPLSI